MATQKSLTQRERERERERRVVGVRGTESTPALAQGEREEAQITAELFLKPGNLEEKTVKKVTKEN